MTLPAIARSTRDWRERYGESGRPSVVTIGNFDGIHLGHRRILEEVARAARASGGLPAVVTFDPHPLRVLRPELAPSLLMTLDERLARFAACGIEAALVLCFDQAFSLLTPEEFSREILVQTLRASDVLVGPNFRFGHNQAGNVATLEKIGKASGFAVRTIAPVVVRGEVVSSSAIRRALADGRISRAGRLLGRPFHLTGRIQAGSGTGKKLIVPTLNLRPEQELLPRIGVYATESVAGGKKYRSATNVGVRPTFDGNRLTIESHLFDFHRELNEGELEICFWRRLRDEHRFHSPEELRAQVFRDLERSRAFFRRLDRERASRRIGAPPG